MCYFQMKLIKFYRAKLIEMKDEKLCISLFSFQMHYAYMHIRMGQIRFTCQKNQPTQRMEIFVGHFMNFLPWGHTSISNFVALDFLPILSVLF